MCPLHSAPIYNGGRGLSRSRQQPVSYLCEVGTLGRPHGCRPQPQYKGGGEEGVELRVELGGYVGGVAEHAHHQRPLHLAGGVYIDISFSREF